MTEVMKPEELSKRTLVVAPVPDAAEHTVSAEIWTALTNEINYVAKRIDDGEELTPEDVKKVRSLKNQVEQYLTTFNKAMRDAQTNYKSLIAKRLEILGYGKIENYIQIQKKKQTDEQNKRLVSKQTYLRQMLDVYIAETTYVKDTVLAGNLFPAFTQRFPNVNSSAKDKEIKNWGPYEAVVKTTLHILDTFFNDPIFKGSSLLPVTSATMQQLLKYVREGNLEYLSVMREIFAKDAEYLKTLELRNTIRTKEAAVQKILEIASSEATPDEKLDDIRRIINITL